MSKPDLGAKRACQSCSTKFFDFNKDPILCPKCGTVFQAAAIPRATSRKAAAEEDETPVDAAAVELVSLEDADGDGAKTAAVSDDDVEVEDDAADDTFLEEEEEDDDDVAGLIDGEIENDEEA